MNINSMEAKITIAKLFELAYSKNKGLTAKIIAEKGNAKLTVDQNGKATFSSAAGIISFSGDPVLSKLGVQIKRVSVSFTNDDGMNVGYIGTFDTGISKVSVNGSFNLEALITSCSGLLCKAARAMKGRHAAYDLELQEIMGQ
ncbi:hypothetical protein [Neptunomonas phycophila]|uniref:hypothetical protein n=1 Tax=Neptunomonas phycophila TaxID=1572645 RepID=UPI0015BE8158|nr:hypothetical protein [Neptunomonas phycophila]QLE99059.1 hypothetical protein FLM49_16295 [Neptunomonas phycophila]